MLIEKNINHNLWSKFIITTYQNNIYSDHRYLVNLENNYENFVLYEKNLPLVGAIIFDDNLENIPTFYNTLFVSSKIKSPHKLYQVCTEFINQILNYKKKIHLRLHHSIHDIRSFQWYNYNLDEKSKFNIKIFYTSVLNIENKNQEHLINSLNNTRRNLIRSAIKNNYYSKISDDTALLNYLNEKTFKRKRSKNEIIMSSEIADKAIKDGYATLMITYDHLKNPFAGSLFLHDEKTSYYSVGGSIPEKRGNGSASLNIYDQILNSKKLKKKNIDFVGINSPKRGYFKTSFGGETKVYFELKINN